VPPDRLFRLPDESEKACVPSCANVTLLFRAPPAMA
jgi:hypothetical protein